jgi:hypothetical protein
MRKSRRILNFPRPSFTIIVEDGSTLPRSRSNTGFAKSSDGQNIDDNRSQHIP